MAEWTEGRTEGGFEIMFRAYDKITPLILNPFRSFLIIVLSKPNGNSNQNSNISSNISSKNHGDSN